MKVQIIKISVCYQMAHCNIPENLIFSNTTIRTSNLTASLYDIIEQNI